MCFLYCTNNEDYCQVNQDFRHQGTHLCHWHLGIFLNVYLLMCSNLERRRGQAHPWRRKEYCGDHGGSRRPRFSAASSGVWGRSGCRRPSRRSNCLPCSLWHFYDLPHWVSSRFQVFVWEWTKDLPVSG